MLPSSNVEIVNDTIKGWNPVKEVWPKLAQYSNLFERSSSTSVLIAVINAACVSNDYI